MRTWRVMTAETALDAFADAWDDKYPQSVKAGVRTGKTSIRSSAIRLTSENLSTPRMPEQRDPRSYQEAQGVPDG